MIGRVDSDLYLRMKQYLVNVRVIKRIGWVKTEGQSFYRKQNICFMPYCIHNVHTTFEAHCSIFKNVLNTHVEEISNLKKKEIQCVQNYMSKNHLITYWHLL